MSLMKYEAPQLRWGVDGGHEGGEEVGHHEALEPGEGVLRDDKDVAGLVPHLRDVLEMGHLGRVGVGAELGDALRHPAATSGKVTMETRATITQGQKRST